MTSKRGIFLGAAASVLFAAACVPASTPDSTGTASGVVAGEWSPEEAAIIAAFPARKPRPRDAVLERRIAEIVATMTLEQKIGQMTQPSILSITPDQVRQYAIGSVLNGGGGWPGGNMHATVKDWTNLADAYSRASLATNLPVKIPLIWGTDAVHGHNNVLGATTFPHNIGLGASHDPDLVQRIGQATAQQVRATGINWAFAPTLAVVQNQRWGRSYESYSSDPALVAKLGGALVRGLQGNLTGDGTVLASAKHFLGDGGTHLGIDQGENRATLRQLVATDAAGYYAALDADVATVMVSYSAWAGDGTGTHGKMHGNRTLITGVLKQRMAFDGLVVSDWNAVEQVSGCERDRCAQAVNAGIDLFMVPDNWQTFIAKTVEDVRAGKIPLSRIDDAVTRILRVKLRMGLFDHATAAGRYTGQAAALDHRALAQEAVRKSAVLLKNDGALPLSSATRVLVVGAAADSFARQSGGWSLTWQGDNTDNRDYPLGETLLGGLRRIYGTANVVWSEDGKGVNPAAFDAVVAVIGETPYAEMKGDVRFPAPVGHSLRFPADLATLERVTGKGVPVVSVLYSGRTVYTNDLLNRSNAFVAAFLPGTEAGALADLIGGRGGHDFSGRLSFAWPNTVCPSGGEPAAEALFPRGYGLTLRAPRSLGRVPEQPPIASCP